MIVCVFFKQKTAYEMRISDWSSDVCSSDLTVDMARRAIHNEAAKLLGAARRQDRGRFRYRAAAVHVAVRAAHQGVMRVLRSRVGVAGMMVIVQIGRASCRERVCQYV